MARVENGVHLSPAFAGIAEGFTGRETHDRIAGERQATLTEIIGVALFVA